nr:hypothetical protein [uncultured bacterium]
MTDLAAFIGQGVEARYIGTRLSVAERRAAGAVNRPAFFDDTAVDRRPIGADFRAHVEFVEIIARIVETGRDDTLRTDDGVEDPDWRIFDPRQDDFRQDFLQADRIDIGAARHVPPGTLLPPIAIQPDQTGRVQTGCRRRFFQIASSVISAGYARSV